MGVMARRISRLAVGQCVQRGDIRWTRGPGCIYVDRWVRQSDGTFRWQYDGTLLFWQRVTCTILTIISGCGILRLRMICDARQT